MARIGIALSGGGHRASVWALGALLYLTDAGQHSRVGAIASVSGGSIANGVVARRVNYAEADGAELRRAIRPALRNIAYEGLFFFGPSTNAYVFTVLGFAGLTVAAFVATLVVSVMAAGILVVALGGGTLVLLAATLILFGRRSLVADRALARVHFNEDGRPLGLAEVNRPVTHIFCATELQAGNHVFFAPSFVYGYRHGVGHPGDLPLSTAVQCSACLPGAFAPRRLPADRHQFRRVADVSDEPSTPPDFLVVNDGGVYDNMGDEWFAGYDRRTRRWSELREVCPKADELVIVNGSGGWGWRPIERWWQPRRELVGVLGSKDVLYNSSTRVRRRDLIETFRFHEATGRGHVGALVHIPQSPYTTADGFRRGHDARGERARSVLVALGDDDANREWWDDVARRNTRVGTVLRKLGSDVTVSLLHHAYVLAMCNLHVVLNYPLLAMPTPEDFRHLIEP